MLDLFMIGSEMQLEPTPRLLFMAIHWELQYPPKLSPRCVEREEESMATTVDYQQGMIRSNSCIKQYEWNSIFLSQYFAFRLVLESPFNNIHEEVTKHPMAALWRKMPWFEWFFSGTLTKNDVGFVSDQHIKDIHIPILILHAKVYLIFVINQKRSILMWFYNWI